MKKIAVIIPAYNEAASIGHVLEALPRFVSAVFVVNNNSSDNTAEVAKAKGATVLFEERKGLPCGQVMNVRKSTNIVKLCF